MRMAVFAHSAAVAIALLTASLISFPSFPNPAPGWIGTSPVQSVNRALKSDRLPLIEPAVERHGFGSSVAPAQSRAKVPVGCDSAFSPISSPRLAGVFGRCTA